MVVREISGDSKSGSDSIYTCFIVLLLTLNFVMILLQQIFSLSALYDDYSNKLATKGNQDPNYTIYFEIRELYVVIS